MILICNRSYKIHPRCKKDPANLAAIFVDPIPEMFTDEHAPDYSSPLIFNAYDDEFLKVESDSVNIYDDPFDSKGEKIKEFTLLIDELDLPYDFLLHSEYDLFNSQDFSRVDVLPSTNNEDKVFNPGILIQEKLVEIITRVVQDKKLAISNASLVLEDFDPPFYEPLFFKEVPKSKMLLPFSSENEEKVFKPGIYTSKKDDVLFSPDNEDKVFNPGIISHEKSVKIITRVTPEKKLVISFASWLFEDFDPPFSELLVFKEVPNSMRLLPFSSENEEKVFKPVIYTFKKFHCYFLSELSHLDIDSFNDIHPYFDDDPLSGSTTYSANSLLEEFANELALISYPPNYDDYRTCDIESDIREIEFLLFQSEDSDFKDLIDQYVLTHFDDLFVDPTPEMFIDEQPPDYSFPPRFDVYPDDFLEIESDATFDDDSFDSEGEKSKRLNS
nr:hypothetical protein [Tanacetum cinerariifolium]